MRRRMGVSTSPWPAFLAALLAAPEALASGGFVMKEHGFYIVDFVVLVGILWYYGRGPAKRFLADRRAGVEREINDAAGVKSAAEARLAKYAAHLDGFDAERMALREDFARDGERERQRLKAATKAALARLEADVERTVAQEARQVDKDLQSAVAARALELAEARVREQLTPATQRRLIKQYLADFQRLAADQVDMGQGGARGGTGSKAARRYAQALFEVTQADKSQAVVARQLGAFADLWSRSDELRAVIRNPVVTTDEKRKLLDRLAGKLLLAPTARRFLSVLLDAGRLGEVAAIHAEFSAFADAAAGRLRATVVSAVPLGKAALGEIQSALERLSGKTVEVQATVDASILGGVVTRLGSVLLDGSVRTDLDLMREALVA